MAVHQRKEPPLPTAAATSRPMNAGVQQPAAVSVALQQTLQNCVPAVLSDAGPAESIPQ